MYGTEHNVGSSSELVNTNHDVFGLNYIGSHCNLVKTLIKPGVHGHMFCSALHFFCWWQTVQYLINEKEARNAQEGEEVEVNEKQLFEKEGTHLLYTRAPGHDQQKPRSKALDHERVAEEAVNVWRKKPLTSGGRSHRS